MSYDLFNAREQGLVRNHSLQKYVTWKRVMTIEVSDKKSMEHHHLGGVNYLDMEQEEHRYLLSAGSRGSIVIYDTENVLNEDPFECTSVAVIDRDCQHGHKFSISAVQWYPHDNGMFVTSSCDGLVKVWDANELKVAEEFKFEGVVYHHRMSTAATKHCLIAVGSDDPKVTLCDIRCGASTHILRGHTKEVLSLAWSPRNQYILVTGSADNKIKMWDIRSAKSNLLTFDQHNGKSIGTTDAVTSHNGSVNGLCFNVDGQRLLSFGKDKSLKCWDATSGRNTLANYGCLKNIAKQHIQLAVSSLPMDDLVFVPDTVDLKLFDVEDAKLLKRLRGHLSRINCCYFDTFKQELYSGACDSNILVWSPQNIFKHVPSKANNQQNDLDVSNGLLCPSLNPVARAMQDTWSSSDDD